MIKSDVSQLRKFSERLMEASAEELLAGSAEELAISLRQAAQERTPVVTGRLKGGFAVSEINRNGYTVTALLTNDVEYASFVEHGHLAAKGKGWVGGRFMLTTAARGIETMAPAILHGRITEFLQGCVSGDK